MSSIYTSHIVQNFPAISTYLVARQLSLSHHLTHLNNIAKSTTLHLPPVHEFPSPKSPNYLLPDLTHRNLLSCRYCKQIKTTSRWHAFHPPLLIFDSPSLDALKSVSSQSQSSSRLLSMSLFIAHYSTY
ncbi:hypothetical protein AYI69_g11062 [Smittium culicis]|uniref:Uncharacterized protein n=1 Tax=Smittium culicis TaxID=133412 RepID=A0A1R1X1C8_9FUNG|nr:hypothetical protein AYI69_g11062 [Smittium culicis]